MANYFINDFKEVKIDNDTIDQTPTVVQLKPVEKNNNEKCDRCWHRNESVGSIPEHEKLCSRCYENVFDNGETRKLG